MCCLLQARHFLSPLMWLQLAGAGATAACIAGTRQEAYASVMRKLADVDWRTVLAERLTARGPVRTECLESKRALRLPTRGA